MQTTLQALAAIAGAETINPPAAPLTVTQITLDSKAVEPGGMFAALPGTRVHGAKFAAESPAGSILTDREGLHIIEAAGDARPVLVVDDVRSVLGVVAAEVYGWASKSMKLIGVTGTSGKTTTTYMLERGLTAAGCKVGLIGTTGTRIDGRDVPTQLTTPEAPKLQELFGQMLAGGVTHVVMEVSSHALMLGRVGGTDFDVAGFTNLSQDHLDFHPTMEDYFAAKALFFDPASDLAARRSVICVDDDWGERMARVAEAPDLVGTRGQAGLTVAAEQRGALATGAQEVTLTVNGATYDLHLPVPVSYTHLTLPTKRIV